MSNYYDEIPCLNLEDFTSGIPEKKWNFSQELGQAYQEIGFATIRNHSLNDELIEKLYSAVQKFFSLPDDIKLQYEKMEALGERGYVGKGKEKAKGRKTGDLKEFYHVGQEVIGDDRLKAKYSPNIWPKEVAEFEKASLDVYRTLEGIGNQILRAIALFLNLEEDYFDSKIKNGNSILRAIHYFPLVGEVENDAVRAAEHCDINLITLLMGASAEGLEVLRKDGTWIPLNAKPGQLIVNVGDMLSRLTNNRLRSTIHRVSNPPIEKRGVSRYSIPFFMHPCPDVDLSCLQNCIDSDHPQIYNSITAEQFLEERLVENGLKV